MLDRVAELMSSAVARIELAMPEEIDPSMGGILRFKVEFQKALLDFQKAEALIDTVYNWPKGGHR